MKVTVIGVGRMGCRYVQVVQELGLSLVGICDQSSESLKIWKQENNVSSDMHHTDVYTTGESHEISHHIP